MTHKPLRRVKLDDLQQRLDHAAPPASRNAPSSKWEYGHSQMTRGNGDFIATFYDGRVGALLYGLDPNTVQELLRGYRTYLYLKANHSEIVDLVEAPIGAQRGEKTRGDTQ